MPPGKVQVPGINKKDTYRNVISKGAKGLGVKTHIDLLTQYPLV